MRDSGNAANTPAISLAEGPTAFHSFRLSFHSFEPTGMLVICESLLLITGMGASGHGNEHVADGEPSCTTCAILKF